MKTWMTLTVTALTMTAGLMAQSMEAKIPFTFTSRGVSMDAGTYAFAAALKNVPGIYQVRETATGKSRFTNVGSKIGERTGASKLVFDCSAPTCALVEVWYGGTGYGLNPTKAEREARQAHLREIPLQTARRSD